MNRWDAIIRDIGASFRALGERIRSATILEAIFLGLPMILLATYFFHRMWDLAFFAAGILALAVAVKVLMRSPNETRHSFESVAALISTLALFFAGYWYFVDRKGVPKLDVTTQADLWPIGEGRALVRVTVQIENVGTSMISFAKYNRLERDAKTGKIIRDDRLKVDIGQILPFDAENRKNGELAAAFAKRAEGGKKSFNMERTRLWPLRAKNYQFPKGEIEAGEVDKYYYKAIVRCHDGMVLAVTARIPKLESYRSMSPNRDGERYVWSAQSVTDGNIVCN